MNEGHLSALTGIVTGRLQGPDAAYRGVCTDSRALVPGNLFVALRGDRFDGHDYLAQAAAAGAVGAVVEAHADVDIPQVLVADTLEALTDMAAAWRAHIAPRVAGVTGSNGKTTVKQMLAAILSRVGGTLFTQGNYNNHIGVPLTLLNLTPAHRLAVIEMGTSGKGEIGALARLARPDVAVVTNASEAHLAGLGTVDNVIEEKGAIYTALPANGVAVINADDAGAPRWTALAGARRIVRFGQAPDADVRVTDIETLLPGESSPAGTRLRLHLDGRALDVRLPLPGAHNALNAAAAAAMASAMGASDADIVDGLAATESVDGRLQWRQTLAGGALLDDTYNANPASVRVAIELLVSLPGANWLVLGDMGELGSNPEARHAAVAQLAREAGIERVFSLGPLSSYAAAAFGDHGEAFFDLDELLIVLRAHLTSSTNVLVKGSRSAHMERVVAGLLPDEMAARAAGGQ